MVEEVGYLYIVKVLCYDEKFKMSLKQLKYLLSNTFPNNRYFWIRKSDACRCWADFNWLLGVVMQIYNNTSLFINQLYYWAIHKSDPAKLLVTELSNKRSGVKSTIFSSR